MLWRIVLSVTSALNQSYLILLRWIYTDFFSTHGISTILFIQFLSELGREYILHTFRVTYFFFCMVSSLANILCYIWMVCVVFWNFLFRRSTRKVWRVIFELEFTGCWCFLRSFFSIHVKCSLVYVFVCSIFLFCSVWRLSFLWKRLLGHELFVMFTNAHKKIPS